jgi:glycosyltransferase involved in cell wall biosynthesis
MKTILIAHNYNEISFAAMSYHLAHDLADKGHRVIFMSHNPYFPDKKVIQKENGEIIVFSWSTTKRPTSLKDFLWYAKIHYQYKPEVIIGHFVGSNISVIVSKIASLGKVKTYEYYHTLSNQIITDLKRINIKQKLLFLRKKWFYYLFCDTIICPSELAKNDLRNFYKLNKGSVILNPMVDRFVANRVMDSNNINISYLGRLDPSKGVLEMIEAYLKYKKGNPNSKIVINIAGGGQLESEIVAMANKNNGIKYHGVLSYDFIDSYLSTSHFAIIPSKFDNLPTVGLEAMMNKTPLLISSTTGLTNYMTDGHDCFIFHPTVVDMIAVFERVDSLQPDDFVRMSDNARTSFLAKYSIKTYCDNFSSIFQ